LLIESQDDIGSAPVASQATHHSAYKQEQKTMRVPRPALALLLLLAGWGDHDPDWPYAGPLPDQPLAVREPQYGSVMSGTRTFRPVEPLPWGGVNRRVTPEKQSAPPTSTKPMDGMPSHQHH
jgi:hypothetical protein